MPRILSRLKSWSSRSSSASSMSFVMVPMPYLMLGQTPTPNWLVDAHFLFCLFILQLWIWWFQATRSCLPQGSLSHPEPSYFHEGSGCILTFGFHRPLESCGSPFAFTVFVVKHVTETLFWLEASSSGQEKISPQFCFSLDCFVEIFCTWHWLYPAVCDPGPGVPGMMKKPSA